MIGGEANVTIRSYSVECMGERKQIKNDYETQFTPGSGRVGSKQISLKRDNKNVVSTPNNC